MSNPTPPWRRIVREQLELLASADEQIEYERNVPHVNITAELLCGWFSDSYHPNDAAFRSCFDEAELDALAKFDAIYRDREKHLPESNGTVKTWQASRPWRDVMQAASETLDHVAA